MALQNTFNALKSKALGVAEYMTPVLKVCMIHIIYYISSYCKIQLLCVAFNEGQGVYQKQALITKRKMRKYSFIRFV